MSLTDKPRTIFLASHNKHKIIELQAMTGNHLNIKDLSEFSPRITWEETANTFQGNARIKALAVRSNTSAAVLADDSGLEVKCLNGAPGVYSSRYGGIEGDDANNNTKLLSELSKLSEASDLDRQAAFICCLVFIDENGNESVFEGRCEGKISFIASGTGGFGYDPLFIPKGYDKSLAELGEEIKNKISHRSKAVEAWLNSASS